MRFMVMVKASPASEAGILPAKESTSAMDKYNQELMRAGVLLDLAALQPSSRGARISVSQGKRTVTDGPFAETRQLLAGYWIIQVKSLEEAIEWGKRVPVPSEREEREIEIRPYSERNE